LPISERPLMPSLAALRRSSDTVIARAAALGRTALESCRLRSFTPQSEATRRPARLPQRQRSRCFAREKVAPPRRTSRGGVEFSLAAQFDAAGELAASRSHRSCKQPGGEVPGVGARLPILLRSGHHPAVTPKGVRQQQRPASFRGCIRRTATVLADDRFGRGDRPEPACGRRPTEASPGRGASRRRASRRAGPRPRLVAKPVPALWLLREHECDSGCSWHDA
jgi:hypothetical protein